MTRTRRIYNNAKRWWHSKIAKTTNGYFPGLLYGERKYEPFKQHVHLHCRCSWCRPKESEKGALRGRRKAFIRYELMNGI